MLAKVFSAGTFGIEAYPVEVEVNVFRSDDDARRAAKHRALLVEVGVLPVAVGVERHALGAAGRGGAASARDHCD